MEVDEVTTGELFYFHTDHLGTSMRLTSETGSLIRVMGYEPFRSDVRTEWIDIPEDIVITENITESGEYMAANSISITTPDPADPITIGPGVDVSFLAAASITFSAGFTVMEGAAFSAGTDLDMLSVPNDVDTRYGFTGQEKDVSGLYYYVARYYDPDLGRFTQPDTLLDGLNRYAYCHNNPVKYVDPTGHFTVCVDGEIITTDSDYFFDDDPLDLLEDDNPIDLDNDDDDDNDRPSVFNNPVDEPVVEPIVVSSDGSGIDPAWNLDFGWDHFGWAAENFDEGRILYGLGYSLAGGMELVYDIAGAYVGAQIIGALVNLGPRIVNNPADVKNTLNNVIDDFFEQKQPMIITNKAGDKILMTADKKIRMDFLNSQNDLPHMHFEILRNNRWSDAFDIHRFYLKK